jgi:hypothetical protein
VCLKIRSIPIEYEGYIVVQRVHKRIVYLDGIYATPYRDTKIPNNGFLCADSAIPDIEFDAPFYGYKNNYPLAWTENIIYGGAIHSTIRVPYYHYRYASYASLAIDVFAWGCDGDLCSTVVYIPYIRTNDYLVDLLSTLSVNKPIYIKLSDIEPYLPKHVVNKINRRYQLYFK